MNNLKKFLKYIVIIFAIFILILNISYPRYYNDEVKLYSNMYGVEENRIFSIIKRESNFNRYAKSNRDAVGLMQLLPTTADEIFDKLKIDSDSRDLYDPKTNIMVGTFYYKMLLDRYDGDHEKALAAYNGGMGNVSRWEKGNHDKFIDNIDFKETYKYVQTIDNNYKLYNVLYNKLNLKFLTLPNFFVGINILIGLIGNKIRDRFYK